MYIYVYILGTCVESGSWSENGGSKSGGMICASCKSFGCASTTADGESPPFMFRPVKDEDAAAVSAADFNMHSLLAVQHLSSVALI